MSEIRAKTDDRKLILTSRPVLTSGCINTDTFSVVFDDTWDFRNAVFYANFYKENNSSDGYIREMTSSFGMYTCDVPEMVLKEAGSFCVGIYACNPDNVIKTSNVVKCDVAQGVAVSTDNASQFTANEVKRFFIHMINATTAAALDYSMNLYDIDLSFSAYMNSLNTVSTSFSAFAESIYDIIKKYVDGSFPKNYDTMQASIIYPVVLSDFFEDLIIRLNSSSNESVQLNEFRSSVYNLILNYIAPEDFNSNTDIIMYSGIIEDFIKLRKTEHDNLLLSMQNLYTGGTLNG